MPRGKEGMTAKERGEVRWYIEQFMDLPEGGNVRRARGVERPAAGSLDTVWTSSLQLRRVNRRRLR
jgi:hypothetical protein